MRKWSWIGAVAVFSCCTLFGLAQEGTKPAATKPAAAAQKEDGDEAVKKGRLPANFGKIGLTEVQKTKIYTIQNQYDDQLDELVRQLSALKQKRDEEVEAVLTEDQRRILKNLVDSNKESRKPKQDPAKTDDTKK